MNKNEIKGQLNKNREKLLLKGASPQLNILKTFKISTKGSVYFKERVAIIKYRGNHYWKDYNTTLPNSIQGGHKLSEREVKVILSTIESYEKYKHYHINLYTWLVSGCLCENLDLIEEGILEI